MSLPSFVTAQFVISALTIVVAIHAILIGCAYLIYLERKISAYIQDRIGPNRVGFDFGLPFMPKFHFWGLGQSLADGVKFLLKEDYMPKGADPFLFTLAPVAILVPALIGFAIVPWGGIWICPDITVPILGWVIPGGPVHIAGAAVNIGLVYLLAVAAVGIYGVVLGGWASNNKYSFLGALRASSQMLSYEIPMGLSLLVVLLMTGSLLPMKIIEHQVAHGWLIVSQPLAAIIFFLCVLAECNRAPFDNAECEQELVGGYHTEYSSMRFALFFLAEYAHMVTNSAMFAVLFLGGFHLPFIGALSPHETGLFAVVAKIAVLTLKIILLISFMMLIRWSLPRLRFDQVMQSAWQGVIPLSMILLVMNAVLVQQRATSLPSLLVANLALAALVLLIQRLLPRPDMNRKVRLPGSRFHPPLHEDVRTRPTLALALEDRPVEGSSPMAGARF
ncbi:MAG: NADH-quinone oxidoreductase subunit H [Phycisphaerae bacterium]|nr:NADH-quinone oxidoreductase subunit H [Phycisphaerae bacterium]